MLLKNIRWVCWISLLFFLFIQSILSVSLSPSYFKGRYQDLQLYDQLDISQEDLNQSITVLIEYLDEKRDSIDVVASIDGELREVFNEKEKKHMADVLKLTKFAKMVRMLSLVVFLISFSYLRMQVKKDALYYIANIWKSVVLAVTFLFGVLIAWLLIDFTSFWTVFHKLLFTNDLWLLNPRTDFMIQMLPESIFMGLVMRICFFVIILYASLFLLSKGYCRKIGHKLQKQNEQEGIGSYKEKNGV